MWLFVPHRLRPPIGGYVLLGAILYGVHLRRAQCLTALLAICAACTPDFRPEPPSAITTLCGNGLLQAFESCDDGNRVTGDGCDSDCRIETQAAWICTTTNKRSVCEQCEAGWVPGERFERCIDLDECAVDNGGCSHACRNKIGDFSCACPLGYRLGPDGLRCTDIDECAVNNGECSDICSNTPGGFVCGCPEGFLQVGGGCEDINECVRANGGCAQGCRNTEGGRACYCESGYTLSTDGVSCDDIDECQSNNGACEQLCENIPGGRVCGCGSDYSIAADGRSCDDVDDCVVDNGGCGDSLRFRCINQFGAQRLCVDVNECLVDPKRCEQICVNEVGGARCDCRPGYALANDGRTCTDTNECAPGSCSVGERCVELEGPGHECLDIDECAEERHNCGPRGVCANSSPGFSCGCLPGYRGDGIECLDIDECAAPISPCGTNAECTNSPGAHQCACLPGFRGDGSTCVDINECNELRHDCPRTANCTNTVGGFDCVCRPGYEGDGRRCLNVDECTRSPCDPDARCHDTPGSFACECNPGFIGDGLVCVNINDCDPNPCVNGVCEDRIQDVACQCFPGYSGDRCQIDVDECADAPCQNGGTCLTPQLNSFTCNCLEGFTGSTCEINPNDCPVVDPCNGHGRCGDLVAGFECACDRGWIGDFCDTDLNECLTANGGCDPSEVCVNLEPPLFKLCEDRDECQTNNGGCEQLCTNQVPGRACGCAAGFRLQGETACVPILECAEGSHDCHPSFGVCSETPHPFSCACAAGFTGDGRTCTDIDECLEANLCTTAGSECENRPGTYACVDINECENDVLNICDVVRSECVDLVGGFECACLAGWQRGPIVENFCVDVDECSETVELFDTRLAPLAASIDFDAGQNVDCTFRPRESGLIDRVILDVDGAAGEVVVIAADTSSVSFSLSPPDVFVAPAAPARIPNGFRVSASETYTLRIHPTGPLTVRTTNATSLLASTEQGDLISCPVLQANLIRGLVRLRHNAGCDQGCVNEPGSASCFCDPFFNLDPSTGRCEPAPVQAVAAGGKHTCIVDSDNDVKCWGSNEFGQLGLENCVAGSHVGDDADEMGRNLQPVLLPGDAQVAMIAAGEEHTCALTRDHRLFCWGENDVGQLGLGDLAVRGCSSGSMALTEVTSTQWPPTQTAIVSITAGARHTCALLDDGTLWCWGDNAQGQILRGPNRFTQPTLVPFFLGNVAGPDVTQVSAGHLHTCIRFASGAARCWGSSAGGALGFLPSPGDVTLRPHQAADINLGGVREIVAGHQVSCLFLGSGPRQAKCIGLGSLVGFQTNAVQVAVPAGDVSSGPFLPPSLNPALSNVAAGDQYMCALPSDLGPVECWGHLRAWGLSASLGSALQVSGTGGASSVTAARAGGLHACVLIAGRVKCWGLSPFGQLGLGDRETILPDTDIPFVPAW